MRKIILVIMDGFGLREADEHNAVAVARKPNLDWMFSHFPGTQLGASGPDVGLPPGQMGNSEVGHLNLGAGRIVYQEVTRIDKCIADGEFFRLPVLLNFLEQLKRNGGSLHLFGLVSNGCVHSSNEHLRAILQLCQREKFSPVYLHAFTDGRDTSPESGVHFIQTVQEWMRQIGVGQMATISGRYWAMDRDKRWDRTAKAYQAIRHGKGEVANDAVEAVRMFYSKGITDEFIPPTVLVQNGQPTSVVEEDDGIFFFNFRADRARQLTRAFSEPGFREFEVDGRVEKFLTMTQYDETYDIPVVFPPQKLTRILPELLAERGLRQLRITETEKYPHVTYFFNGGEEKPFEGEDRVVIPSPKVATHDLQPEMSAPLVTKEACRRLHLGIYDFVFLNFANCDMVGHSGILDAARRAVEAVDAAVGEVWKAAEEMGYSMLLTADHGNAEMMWDPTTNGPHTAHTTNPVPFYILSVNERFRLRDGGKLCDVAPTILKLMDVSQPM
ncbi:MAG: 2,3-bisphosphoglycerate-independent phosphoglycerate mutase, partial [bacterium]